MSAPASEAAAATGDVRPDLPIDELKDPMVRDLAWLLASPALLREQPPVGVLADPLAAPGEAARIASLLRALDTDPDALHRALAALHVTRLGRYAEALLAWFLEHDPATRLVAANVALRRAGVTLGECDFLVETANGRRLHWELAVKCYLHAGAARGQLADYVGPNLQDRFDLKLAHLLGHQLPLSAREEFASLGLVGPWHAQMFIKGWLFYPQAEAADSGALDVLPADAPELDPAHPRGWWTTRTAWPDFAAAHAPAWRVLPRLEWLAPRCYEAGDAAAAELVDAATLAPRLVRQTGPTMVAGFASDAQGRWIERSRGFVVPDAWPALAQAFARK
ncbi:DUF1853 family protein [Paraburkholderia sp.]|uniref:DUF1853 family protein n=1 Tax=Paraburkholderia sp. TaxID=1926495 RepID=UPI003D6E0854